jgi:amidohydrolase
VNDPGLTERMAPTLKRVAGSPAGWGVADKSTGGEDFSFFANKAPGLFVILGVTPPDQLATAAANHSPQFFVDEGALLQGVRAMSHLTLDYLSSPQQRGEAAR